MSQITLSNEMFDVKLIKDQIVTTSINIAKVFEKRHDNVIKAIEQIMLDIPNHLCNLNFEETFINVSQPKGGIRKTKAYLLTKKAFTWLAMGFTGKKALQFKIAYTDEFERMEAELQNKNNPPFLHSPTPHIEAITKSTTEDRKPLKNLVDVWANTGNIFHSLCWKQINTYFQIEKISELPKEWIGDAIHFVQEKIDALAIQEKPRIAPQLAFEELCIIEDSERGEYYTMIEKLYQDTEKVRTYIERYKKQTCNKKLPKELNALRKNAENCVDLALCNMKSAQYAIHCAIRIRGEFEFIKPVR